MSIFRRGKKTVASPKRTGIRRKERLFRMKARSIMFISYRNLAANKLRSILTVGGVAVGIGIITFLIALGFGVQKMVIDEVTGDNPVNVIDIDNGTLDNFVSLDDEHTAKIADISGVMDVERKVGTGGKFYYGESQTDVVIYGETTGYFGLANAVAKHGSVECGECREKVFVSTKLANLLGFDDPAGIVGQRVSFDIILSRETNSGLQEEENRTGNTAEVVAVIENGESVQAIFAHGWLRETFGIDLAQWGKIRVSGEDDVRGIRDEVEVLGFQTESVVDTVKEIDSFFTVIRAVLIVFGAIIMSISAMGMLNTLTVSLLQRTKEVGILKALGTKRNDIFKMFIFEAALISSLGGVLGFLGGYVLARGLNETFNVLAAQRGLSPVDFIEIPPSFLLALIGFIVFLGLATGIIPARRASRTHALDALRYE